MAYISAGCCSSPALLQKQIWGFPSLMVILPCLGSKETRVGLDMALGAGSADGVGSFFFCNYISFRGYTFSGGLLQGM